MKKMIKSTVLLTLVTIIFFSGIVTANSGQASGLGHDFTTIEGAAAIFSNPAFVNQRENRYILELDGQLSFWNNGLSSSYFNKYLKNKDKNNILDNIEDNGLVLNADGKQNLKIAVGSVGFFGGLKENAQGSISADIIEVILEGNEIGREYKLDGTDLSAGVYADTGLNFSYPIERAAERMDISDFKIGANLHYLYGGIVKINGKGKTTLDYNTQQGEGYIEMKYAEEAVGYAFDLGALFEINDKTTVGASVMNLGYLKGKDPRYSKMEVVIDGSEVTTKEIEDQKMQGELVYKLPRKFKVGTSYKYRSNMDLFADYTLTNYDSGNNDHKLAGAVEYKPIKRFPLRFGVNYSTLQNSLSFSGGMGFYLGPVHLDLGFSDLKTLFQNAKGLEAGLSVSLLF